MAATTKSMLAIVLVIVVGALAVHSQTAAGQSTESTDCSAGIGRLAVCAPYVVPGVSSAPPSQECCGALKNINTECLCSTIDIISRLPATCGLPQATCPSSP